MKVTATGVATPPRASIKQYSESYGGDPQTVIPDQPKPLPSPYKYAARDFEVLAEVEAKKEYLNLCLIHKNL